MAILHYAACRDCDRHSWADSRDEAAEDAEEHGSLYGHQAYYGTTEVEV